MLKTVSIAWVKNVYSPGIAGGINSGFLYTGSAASNQVNLNSVYNYPVFTLFIHGFTTYLYTQNIRYFNLLKSHLYPQSTAPINKKKKGKKGKEQQ